MTRRRARSTAHPGLALVALLLGVAGALAPVTAPIAAAATDGLTVTAAATYSLVPARSVVRVVVDVTARNDKPNLVSGGVRTRYFYDDFRIGIQPEAASIRATDHGATLGTTTRARDGYSELEVRFPSSLFYHQVAKVRVTFDLPGGAPRSKSEVRVGPAFATFAAWAFGESGSVRIVVPAGFEAATSGSDVVRSTSGSNTVFTAANVTDVPSWDVTVNADRPSALTNTRIDLPDGEHLVVHAWPDDPSWSRDVTELLSNGLPKLVEETGLTWPVSGDLDVFEVHTPLLEGYAGIFYEGENRIEISEDLDDLTILHEATHAWFNDTLFDGRWINEGFADTFASRTLDAIGLGGWAPNAVNPTQTAAVRLNDWTFPGRIADAQTDAQEAYGYDAAWTVVRSIAAELGPDRMRAVLAAAESRQIAYAGAGTPEAVTGRTDWRRLLDLFDERGGSRTADDVFRRWVVNDAQRAELDARQTARTAYAGLVDAGAGWLPPMFVRDAMAAWRFDEAASRIDAAHNVLDQRAELDRVASQLGAPAPTDLRAAYQTATSSLESAKTLATREIGDGQAAVAAATAVAAPRDPFMTIGLLGSTPPEARLATIRAGFSRGDATMATEAAALSARLAGAAGVGRERVLVVTLIAVIAIVMVFATILIAAHHRRVRRGAGPTRTHVLAASADAAAGAPTMSLWPTVPVASTEARAPIPHGPPALASPERSGLRVAMAHPVDGPPPADDTPDREGADAGTYATLADHPASDETMATPAEPPSDPDEGPADKGDAS
ncbi:MAG TPA: hypothetical protein VID95_04755 [Candidatus Limnocylindrales bacterium]